MILSFADKETEKIFQGEYSKRIPEELLSKANQKLIVINLSASLNDLYSPPGNRLEPLKGRRTGEWSIRINRQWRITFTPVDGGKNYINVKVEDYY